MERPGSRGNMPLSFGGVSKAPTGNPLAPPPRPSTPSRAGLMMGGTMGPPPQTAMRATGGPGLFRGGAPPGTAQRMGTASGRPGTGFRPGTASLNANVQVTGERPVTQQGMAGMQSGGQGPGRQIFDKSYYMNILRQKKTEVLAANEEMTATITEFERGEGKYQVLEQRMQELDKDVEELQGQLGVFNMVVDKAATNTSPADIADQAAALDEQNRGERRRVDSIFTERSEIEARTQQLVSQIDQCHQALEAELSRLPESSRQRYYDLQGEIRQLSTESKRMEEDIQVLSKDLSTAEVEIARYPLKHQAMQFQDQIKQLNNRKFELQAAEEKAQLSPDAQREELMGRIKVDNIEVERATQVVKRLHEEVKRLEKGGGAVPPPPDTKPKMSAQEKMEELAQKDAEMSDFISTFDDRKVSKAEEKKSKEESIVVLLDRVSRLEALAASSSQEGKEGEKGEETIETLTEQLQAKRTELRKIDTLEEKIKSELEALTEKTETLQQDLEKFNQLETMKTQANEKRTVLQERKMELEGKLEVLKVSVKEKEQKYGAKAAQLHQSSGYTAVEKLESKLRTIQQNTYHALDSISCKENEANYQPLQAEVENLSSELNFLVTRAAQAQ